MFWFSQLYASRIFYAIGFTAMGIALELAQGWLGTRQYDLVDMLANTAGVLAGWLAARLLPRLLPPP